MSLSGRVALVTGGSRGIGRSIALALGVAGASIAVTYCAQREQAVGTVAMINTIGGRGVEQRANAFQYDASRPAPDVQRVLVALIRAYYGPIDVLVNNAAIAQEKAFASLSEQDWQYMMQVNLYGAAFLCQSIHSDMQERHYGRIVNVVSLGGQIGGIIQPHYAASKAALINLTKSLARLYAKDGITVNAVAPGLVDTDMIQSELATEVGQDKVARIPLGRIAMPEEVAAAVVWLCSEEARYVTGQCLNVNGGMYCG